MVVPLVVVRAAAPLVAVRAVDPAAVTAAGIVEAASI